MAASPTPERGGAPAPAAAEAPAGGRVARSAAWRILESVGIEAISFLIFVGTARLLSAGDFGAVSIATSLVILLQALIQHGLPEALIQRERLTTAEQAAAMAASLRLSVVLVTVALALAWPLGLALRRPEFPLLFAALAPMLLVQAAIAPMHAMLRRGLDYRSLAMRGLAGTFAGGAIAIAAGVAGAGPWALVAQQWTVALVGLAMLWRSSPLKPPQARRDAAALAPLIATARPVRVAQFAGNAARRLDTVALGLFLADHEVGLYFMMMRLIASVQQVTQFPIAEVGLSVLSRLQDDVARHRQAVVRAMRVAGFACLLCFGGLAVIAPGVVPALFGADWSGAVAPLQWLAPLSTAGALAGTAGQALLSAGAARETGLLALGAALLQLAAVAVTASFGLESLALSIGIAQCLALVVAFAVLVRRIGLSPWRLAAALLLPVLLFLAARAAAQWSAQWTARGPVEPASLADSIVQGVVFAGVMLAGGAIALRGELDRFRRKR